MSANSRSNAARRFTNSKAPSEKSDSSNPADELERESYAQNHPVNPRAKDSFPKRDE